MNQYVVCVLYVPSVVFPCPSLQTQSGYMTPIGNDMANLTEIRRVSRPSVGTPLLACRVFLHDHLFILTLFL